MIPVAKSELLLFDETPLQSSITSSSWVDFHTISNPANNGPLEFYIGGTQDEYLDLNDTKLYLEVRLTTDPAANVCAPVNLLHSSLFQDVAISLNDVVVQGGTQLYAYKAMLESMLQFDNGVKKTQLRAAGYCADAAGRFNSGAPDNAGFATRAAWTSNQKIVKLIGPLHLDIMTQPRYILPRVDVRVRMTRQTNASFYINSFDINNPIKTASIEITKAVLYVRKVKTLPSVVEGHEMGLLHSNALYPIQHVDMQYLSISSGVSSFNRENLFQGRMPKFVAIAMVADSAFSGNFTQNPFNFRHFNINYCGLFRDGECIPERTPYTITDGHTASDFTRPYMGMLHALEMFNRNDGNGITLEEYAAGSTIFVFNLTPDLTAGSGTQQTYRTGNIRLEMKFGVATPSAINVIVYAVFDGKIEITKDRNIHLDYQ